MQGSDVCTSDDYAAKFSEFIRKWCNDRVAIDVAEKRMEKYRGKISEKTFLNQKTYLTLAYILNSLTDLTKGELRDFDCQTWINLSSAEEHKFGWPELFFAAGLLLNNEDTVDWRKMASVIHGLAKSINVDVSPLFELYAGDTVLELKSTRICTDLPTE